MVIHLAAKYSRGNRDVSSALRRDGATLVSPMSHVEMHMKHIRVMAIAIALLWSTPAFAQLVQSNQLGVTMGHVHLLEIGRAHV